MISLLDTKLNGQSGVKVIFEDMQNLFKLSPMLSIGKLLGYVCHENDNKIITKENTGSGTGRPI